MKNNTFEQCFSNTDGGAIKWTYAKPEIEDSNIYSNNKANLYGDNIASVPFKLKIVDK
jgi:hypothetical protein